MKQNIIDSAQFTVAAGAGGDGAISFRREKYVPKGGPDGGKGGRGGSVIITANPNINTLRFFAGKNRFEAPSGQKGGKRNQFGLDAADLILEVPVGTQVYVNVETARLLTGNVLYGTKDWQELGDHQKPDKRLLRQQDMPQDPEAALAERFVLTDRVVLDEPNSTTTSNDASTQRKPSTWLLIKDFTQAEDQAVLAQGGKQGLGNAYYKSSRVTTPKFAQRGEAGERFDIRLELKVLADVGLVGLPNVGKSTLLSVLTRARPEIANYPFTTLTPNLGVLIIQNPKSKIQDLVIADIPGLIEGAHQGKGLGDQFLKHVERCRMLIYVLAPMDADLLLLPKELAQVLLEQLATVRQEVSAYSPHMQEKKSLVVVNKADVMSEAHQVAVSDTFGKEGIDVIMLSAAARHNLNNLVERLVLGYDRLESFM